MSTPPNKTQPQSPPPPAGVSLTRTRAVEQFVGPLPHPDILARYNTIVPGAAERILTMAEQDFAHMREMEKTALLGIQRIQRRGQLFGLIVGLAALGACISALYFGYPTTAGVLGGSTLVGLVAVFVIGRRNSSTTPPA